MRLLVVQHFDSLKMQLCKSIAECSFRSRDFLFFIFFSERAARAGGGGGGALPDFFFFSFFSTVQQTTSGIGHRVK